MNDFPRLIEHAFPLKQTSLDSVHEKNVRHGHISTLHIWPARRPLAACRAALIATLLPDPGTPEKRKELCEKIGGTVVKNVERKKMPNGQTVERIKEETVGGILHWGREASNAADLEWFRKEIRKAYGGRAPKVLDPFAGGGAIPLEAMRLGCEATAVDINPVAWFILKCTLEYPQKLAGQKLPLPTFILGDRKFMEDFYKAQGLSAAQIRKAIETLGYKLVHNEQLSLDFKSAGASIDADLAWHVRAWGQWVLARARKDLAAFYPTYAEFEPLKKDQIAYEHRPMQLVPLQQDGKADINALNKDLSTDYIAVKANPRWIAKPTVAYLWARAVVCKNCRAQLPLLKTRWLCKKDGKRVLLTMQADQPGAVMTVTDFLNHVRRMVVDYVVGQVLSGEKDGEAEMSAADRLDEPTAYYLLHRHDFGLGEAPVGTCILYAVSCGLSDHELVQTWDLLAKTGGKPTDDDDDAESVGDEGSEPEAEESGSKVRLKTWTQRKNKTMGYEAPNGRPVPLIDRVHRLMQLWKAGDVHKVDEYLDEHGLRRHELFKRLVQSLVELAEAGSEERALLESLSNHIGATGTKANADQLTIGFSE